MLGFLINFYRNIKYYFTNISIHGLCTIFRSTYWPEMIFWIIIFLFSVQYLCALIFENLIGFYNQPVTKSIDSTAYPVSLIPFPAITVCNFNTIQKSKTISFIKMLVQNGIKGDDAERFLHSLSLLRNPEPIDIKPYQKIYKVLADNRYNDSFWMENLAQPCDRMLQYCSLMDKEINCSKIFTRSTADLGYCCSFNSILNNPKEKEEYYTMAGPIYGMYLRFNVDVKEYVTPTYNVTGILVLVHNKESYASSDLEFYSVVEPGKQVSMKLIPDVFDYKPGIKTLPTSARNCWLENEGTKYGNLNYSFENCMHMCKSNTIANICGCIPHFHAKLGQWRYCTLLDMPCLEKNYANYSALHIKIKNDDNKHDSYCDCLPPCSGYTYAGVIEALYYKDKYGKVNKNYTGVRIFFQSNWCKKYSMSRSMTAESFIALVGGFFSLCMGGSLLSACEIIYYFVKSLFTKAPDTKNYPSLYWSEFDTNRKVVDKHIKNVVIFNPTFQNNYFY